MGDGRAPINSSGWRNRRPDPFTINKRTEGQPHKIKADWRAELDKLLRRCHGYDRKACKEERAREEKAAALTEIAAPRFSVLMDPRHRQNDVALGSLSAPGDP